jgi:hypothetical protein
MNLLTVLQGSRPREGATTRRFPAVQCPTPRVSQPALPRSIPSLLPSNLQAFKGLVFLSNFVPYMPVAEHLRPDSFHHYWLDHLGVRVPIPVGASIFTSPCRPDRLWGSPNFPSNGHRGLFPRGYSGRGVKLTTHFQLVLRSRNRGFIHPLPHTPSWRSA